MNTAADGRVEVTMGKDTPVLLLNYSVIKDYQCSLHRADCSAILQDQAKHWANGYHYPNAQAAVDDWFDAEMLGLGYGLQDLKVHACVGVRREDLEDPGDKVKCRGCGEPWNVAYSKGCSHDGGCRNGGEAT
jgi:hypothetical protein